MIEFLVGVAAGVVAVLVAQRNSVAVASYLDINKDGKVDLQDVKAESRAVVEKVKTITKRTKKA